MPLDTFTAPLPANTGGGVYADQINAAIEEIRDKLEVAVPAAAININSDLLMNNSGATTAKFYGAQSQSVDPGSPGNTNSAYVKNGDWYLRDGSGNVIRLSQLGQVAGVDTYGNRTRTVPIKDVTAVSGTISAITDPISVTTSSASGTLVWGPLPLRLGERVTSATVRTTKAGTGQMQVFIHRSVDGAARANQSSAGSSTTSGGPQNITATGLTGASVQGENYYVVVTFNNSGDVILWISFTMDKTA